MAKTLSDYPVTFPYGATSYPYSPSRPHHGHDIACPCGTPIVVGGTQLGSVGTTGDSSGCHTHIDKNKGLWQNAGKYLDPSNWRNVKGKVVFASDAGTAGLCVVVETKLYYWRFLHMSKISVKVGDIVGEDMADKLTPAQANQLAAVAYNRQATQAEKSVWSTKTVSTVLDQVFRGKENKTLRTKASNYDKLSEENKKLKAELAKGDEANLLGKAIIPVLAKLGYKKG